MENLSTEKTTEETTEPKAIELVRELHTAVYGESRAGPNSPRSVWKMLLNEVTRMRTELERWPRMSADDRAILEEFAALRRLAEERKRSGDARDAAIAVEDAADVQFRQSWQNLERAQSRFMRLAEPED